MSIANVVLKNHHYKRRFSPCFILILGLTFSVISCKEERRQQSQPKENPTPARRSKTLIIQPLGDISSQQVQFTTAALQKIFARVQIHKAIPMQDIHKNEQGTRYRADKLIRYLSDRTPPGNLTIGLTNKDISTTKGKYSDWGVFGLGYCPGRACIASTFRLKGKNQTEKLFKVAIHELGHTEGLPHCSDPVCYMRDAEGKDHLNEETQFCRQCVKRLRSAGWNIVD